MKYRLTTYRGARRIRITPGTYDSLRVARQALAAAQARYPSANQRIEIQLDGHWEPYE